MIFFPLQHSFSVMISRLYTQLQQLFCINCQKIQNWESYCLEKLYTVQSLVYSGLSFGFFIYIQYINTH